MTIDVLSKAQGKLYNTIPNYRPTKLIPIDLDLNVFVQTKTTYNDKICSYYDCSKFDTLITPIWSEYIDNGEFVLDKTQVNDLFQYTKYIFKYEDTVVENYNFIFYKSFFSQINIVKYSTAIRKTIRTICGV